MSDKTIKPRTVRESNFEAMRVFAMLMVIMAHCVFFSCGKPKLEVIHTNTLGSFYYSEVEALALVCVNCFILISGYFGIKVRTMGVVNLLFIVFFYKVTSFVIASLCMGHLAMNAGELVRFTFLHGPDWFIWSYLCLLIFVPMLNTYALHAERKALCRLILIYFAVEIPTCIYQVYGFPIFNQGFSTLSFIGLYLLGRYYRLYGDDIKARAGKLTGIMVYLLFTLMATSVFIGSALISESMWTWCTGLFINYSSPFTIAASFGVLLFFSSLKLQSRFVNWLGASAFAVYLIHLNPFVLDKFIYAAVWIYRHSWPVFWVPALVVFCCLVYIACTLIDQVRILCWNGALRLFRKKD